MKIRQTLWFIMLMGILIGIGMIISEQLSPYSLPLSSASFLSYYAQNERRLGGMFNILLAIVCILILKFWEKDS